MFGFFVVILVGIPLYFLLQPPRRAEPFPNTSFQNKYLLDLKKLGYHETGENID
jgi:hypothetical protein